MARFLVKHGSLRLHGQMVPSGSVVDLPDSMADCPALEKLPPEEKAQEAVPAETHIESAPEEIRESAWQPKRKKKKA